MPRFSEQFVQQVAQATDIVDLISQYVALKRKGHEFVGLCPFHDDKRPSMNVSPTKQIFKCFACGAGGGVFQFLILYDKMSFPEAVRTLAERANIPLPVEAGAPSEPVGGLSKNDLLRVTAAAQRFFQSSLQTPVGRSALEYARGRGLSDESIERFGLGFAPDSWDGLIQFARRQAIGETQLVTAGLAVRREQSGGCYDRFRNRLIFPILDPTGGVIGFGGRALAAEERAKYLNSPETPLFDKSANLYALNWARETIVKDEQAVVVEGYLDVLLPHQAGLTNVVATLGTALTERHVRLLSRYAREVVLLFDSDAAGQAAAERALEIFLAQQVNVRIAAVGEGKDPADFVLARGGDALKALIAEAPDALQYAWTRREEAYRQAGGNLADRRRIVDDFLRLITSSAVYGAIDEIRRGQLAQHIAHMLNVPLGDLQAQMRRLARRLPTTPAASPAPAAPAGPPKTEPALLAERHVLEVLLNRSDLFDHCCERVDPRDFADPALRAIATAVWDAAHAGQLRLDELLACEPLAPLGGLLADLATEGERRGNYEQTLDGAVELIVYRRNRQETRELRSDAMSDDDKLRRFHNRLNQPDARRRPKIL